jgi:hypothetical protein
MGATSGVNKAPVTTTGTRVETQQPAQTRKDKVVGAATQFARDVFAQDASKNPFDTRQGPGLKEIARNTLATSLNMPKDFVGQVKDLAVSEQKPASTNSDER